jgi:hypothetical protein
LIDYGFNNFDTLEIVAKLLDPKKFVEQRRISKRSLDQVKELLKRCGLELRKAS